jgi:alcohol dehydrogenase
MLLPSVVRWNGSVAGDRYAELLKLATSAAESSALPPAERLARRLEELTQAGGLRMSLGAAGVPQAALPTLAGEAAQQWTGGFNPRPFDQAGAMEVYQWAY